MTPATLFEAIERPALLSEQTSPAAPSPTPFGGRGPTLDDVLTGAWEGLLADRAASCPVCAGALVPRYGSGPGPVAGRCTDCGTELS